MLVRFITHMVQLSGARTLLCASTLKEPKRHFGSMPLRGNTLSLKPTLSYAANIVVEVNYRFYTGIKVWKKKNLNRTLVEKLN